MIIISDCITKKMDEGCIKVASSLAKKMKIETNASIISYGTSEKSEYVDEVVEANKFFSNKEIYSKIETMEGNIIYIPFSSNSLGGIIRAAFLKRKSKRTVYVLFALRHPMSEMARRILSKSGVKIIVVSKESYDFYKKVVENEVIYLKTGIETSKFLPVTGDEKKRIREKYGIDANEKVILHVGHLKTGRNVDKLLHISEKYKVVIVVSSVTEKDTELEKQLRQKENIVIIDTFLENIEEVYQMADLYVFPVEEEQNCIDVPLSVLEAASCNLPVVCTEYGELKEFRGKEGFFMINGITEEKLNNAIDEMIGKSTDNRNVVLEYDWSNSIAAMSKL